MSDETTAQAMYAPTPYTAATPREIVVAYPFALFVTGGLDGLFATATPLYFETDDPAETRIIGHLSRANPQASTLRDGDQALALFSGPHAYISASWYRERPTVPTWNYLAAQVRGTLEIFDDDERQLAVLRRIIELSEQGNDNPWTIEQAPEGRVETLMPRIRSFRLTVDRIDGATKLSQAQPPSDRARVIDALEQRGSANDLAVAEIMRAFDGLPPPVRS